jgi:hypothetical protein
MAVQISGNDITVPRDTTVTRNLTVGGVLTYEDVTNVDSIGIVTARAGVLVGSGITLSKDGDIFATGVTTSTTFSGNFSGGTVSGTTGTFTGDVDIADKIIHTGDTNTAIRFPAADTFTVETGGSERLRIDSSGRLLLGTATANSSDRFTIVDPGDAFMSIRSDAAADDTNQILDFAVGTANRSSSNLTATISAVIPSGSTAGGTLKGDLKFFTNGGDNLTEKLRIDSSGNVIVNDTTADGNVHPDTKLHVKGGITFRELTSASEGALPAITQWSSDGVGQDLAIGTRSAGGDVLFFTGNTGTDGDWGNSSNAEKLRVTTDGLTFNGDTAAANALDDYEEGTWAPTLLSGNSLSFSQGRYVKIGAMVYAFWEITLPSTSATNHMIINNTPFTSINHNASCGGTARDYQNYDIENGPIYHINKADTKIQFYKNSGQNFVESNGSGLNFRGCSIYQTET